MNSFGTAVTNWAYVAMSDLEQKRTVGNLLAHWLMCAATWLATPRLEIVPWGDNPYHRGFADGYVVGMKNYRALREHLARRQSD